MSKFSGKTFFAEFQKTVFENNFYEKNLYCVQSLWRTAQVGKFYAIYLTQTKEVTQKWNLWH